MSASAVGDATSGEAGRDPSSLLSGFELPSVGNEEPILSEDNKSDTSETSSSGSSAVGPYAMYTLRAGEEGEADSSILDCGVEGCVATLDGASDDYSRASPQDDQRTSSKDQLERSSMIIPEEAAIPSGRRLGKVRPLSSQCLEGLGWGESREGQTEVERRWRGRSESEPRIPGASYFSNVIFVVLCSGRLRIRSLLHVS